MRHAFADHIARVAGIRPAQVMLGHASISTTEGYLGAPTMDELEQAVEGVRFAFPLDLPATPNMETVGIEPTSADASGTVSTSVVGSLDLASR
jgi:hypothetical protein